MRIATDIGGTFTDLVYLDEETNEIGLAKAATTPPQFEQGVLAALEKAGIGEHSHVSSFIHGTTVVINTITERTGSKTALVTTKGFRDVLDITRSNRPGIYDFRFRKPTTFVPRRLCFEVAGRMDHHGRELAALSRADLEAAAAGAAREGIEAIAVCFLHSYANPEHEIQAGEILAERLPETWVTLSHEITQEWREYERSSSAVLNAYVQGSTSRYVHALRRGIASKGIRDRLYVMQSSGGVMSFDRAERTPLNLIPADGLPPRSLGMFSRIPMSKGDIVRILTGTGGGWGDPLERDPELVAADVREGFVSLAGAESTYGVVVDPETFEVRSLTAAREGRDR